NPLEVFARSTFRFEGALSGTGGLTKSGEGTLWITGTNTYTGPTRVSAGRLALASFRSLAASSSINVQPGAAFHVSTTSMRYTVSSGQTLTGNSTVIWSITINGTLACTSSPSFYVNGTTLLSVSNGLALAGNPTLGLRQDYRFPPTQTQKVK